MMYKLVVMGVAGSGKTTLANGLARELGCRMVEGDDLHLPESRAKMRAGIALGDRDREPWLDRLADEMASHRGDMVLTCSALKRVYRERLRRKVPGLRFVFIDIAEPRARERVALRKGHAFPASLVASQFEALEPPTDEPGVLHLAAAQTEATQIATVAKWLKDPAATGPAPTEDAP